MRPPGSIELLVVEGGERSRRHRCDAAEVAIGRDAGNDLVLTAAGVSRRHALLRKSGAGWWLSDCGSANGTALNGRLLTAPARVRVGDRIGLGPALLQVEALAAAAPAFALAARRSAAAALAPLRAGASPRTVAFACAVALAACGGIALCARRARCSPAGPACGAATLEQAGVPPAPGAGEFAGEPRVEPASADPAAAREAYERGRRKLDERRVAPRNLYDAWSDFTRARALLGSPQPPPALSGELEAKIAAAAADLQKDCARLLFAGARQEKYGQAGKAQQAWREILQRFPGDDPWRCRLRASENLRRSQDAAASE